ncbi:MAG: hypothetical protein DYG89_39025 [Caldilinea sp. CFX5]|nr:hypothetical protein [Caldilinea sp. CFX5]
MSNAETVFTEVKKSVVEACKAKKYLLVEDKAIQLGFSKTDNSQGLMLKINFLYQVGNNERVELEFRSYDQSGPFQHLPDMNKFEVRLYKADSLRDSYSDLCED